MRSSNPNQQPQQRYLRSHNLDQRAPTSKSNCHNNYIYQRPNRHSSDRPQHDSYSKSHEEQSEHRRYCDSYFPQQRQCRNHPSHSEPVPSSAKPNSTINTMMPHNNGNTLDRYRGGSSDKDNNSDERALPVPHHYAKDRALSASPSPLPRYHHPHIIPEQERRSFYEHPEDMYQHHDNHHHRQQDPYRSMYPSVSPTLDDDDHCEQEQPPYSLDHRLLQHAPSLPNISSRATTTNTSNPYPQQASSSLLYDYSSSSRSSFNESNHSLVDLQQERSDERCEYNPLAQRRSSGIPHDDIVVDRAEYHRRKSSSRSKLPSKPHEPPQCSFLRREDSYVDVPVSQRKRPPTPSPPVSPAPRSLSALEDLDPISSSGYSVYGGEPHGRGVPETPASVGHKSTSTTTVLVAPGVELPLRGADETYQAVQVDFYVPCQCGLCALLEQDGETETNAELLFCIQDAAYVVCPTCKTVSPLAVDDTDGGSSGDVGHGVGLGFTLPQLARMQAEIASSRT